MANAAEAYELDGYKPNRGNACKLKHKETIKIERLTRLPGHRNS